MRSRILVALMVLLLAAPASAVITDVEPANDFVATAPVQFVKTGTVTTDGGELVLEAGDIDFVGIAALSVGDVITVTTTPLGDALFQVPDTMVGVFDSSTTDPAAMILCRGNDIANNAQDNCPGGNCPGWGSICRYMITAPGDYYVGVTGYRPTTPGGCTAGVNCTSHPFDGGIGSIPCEEGGEITCGDYQVTIAVNSLITPTPTPTPTATPTPTPTPEPGVLLQLVSGGIWLAWLSGRRNRRMAPSSPRVG